MLPWKIFKIKDPRLAKNAFPREFSLEKLDKCKSAHSLALKFGCLKKLTAGFGGGGTEIAPLSPHQLRPGKLTKNIIKLKNICSLLYTFNFEN